MTSTQYGVSSVATDSKEQQYQSEKPFKALNYLYRGYRRKLSFAVLLQIIKNSGSWVMPLITAGVVNIITYPQQHDSSEIFIYAGIALIIFVQNMPTNYLYIYMLSQATRSMEANLRRALAWRLQHVSMHFYHKRSTGTLQTKLLRDVEMIEQLTKQLVEMLPSAVVPIIVAVIVTALRAPWFLLFFVLTVPVAVLLAQLVRIPLRQHNTVFREEIESLSDKVSEMVRLLPITRAHGIERSEIKRLEEHLQLVKQAGVRLDSLTAFFGAGSWVTFRVADVLCLSTASYVAYMHILPLTVGDVVLLTAYFATITASVTQLINTLPIISKGTESIRSLGAILEYYDFERNEGKKPVKQVKGHFVFKNVQQAYPEARRNSITNFSLEVQPGECIAIVGPSGSGKSTLLNMVIGFLRPNSGQIFLDGQDMNELDLRTYRQFISVVSQETVLFRGTIRDNLLYGITDKVDETALIKAAEAANARAFIEALPDKYDTIIGENGAGLSGGQRQRLAIARALLRDPKILLLDEATSALDPESERLVQQALERLMKGRTTFIVAHRFSTIKNADRIAVMENGQLTEVGSHAELLQRQGAYTRLYDLAA